MYYGAAYYPEHRDPSRWEHDLDNMVDAGVNSLRVAEFAWILLEPTDGVYDFSWLDKFKTMASERGIKLLMCPPIRTIPAWLFEQAPSLAIEDEEGRILEYGSRYSFCINHPLLRKKGKELAEAMALHYGDDKDIAGWHLDNEHGDEPDCHCPICKKKFQDWCEKKYGTIEALNEAWGLRFWGLNFQKFSQVPTPRFSKTFHSPGHSLDWRRFRSDSTVEIVAMQAETIRKNIKLPQFITTNNQAMWNNRTDYYDMAKHLDITGTNYYPQYGENSRNIAFGLASVRSYKQGAGVFQVHELRNGPHAIAGAAGNTPEPGEVARLAMHCLANGAKALYFFRWRGCPFGCEQHHGTITGYDGERLAVYKEVAELGNWLKKYGNILDTTKVKSDVAILYDFETRWVMETGVSWNGPKKLYPDQAQIIYKAITQMGINCDAVSLNGNFNDYKVIIVPALACINDKQAKQMKEFVENGGTLICHPFSGIKDEYAKIHNGRLHPVLQKLFGLRVDNYATISANQPVKCSFNNSQYEATMFSDIVDIKADNMKLYGSYLDVFYSKNPLITKHNAGKGSAIYITSFMKQNFYSDFLKKTLNESGITSPFYGFSDRIEICTQVGNNMKLVFMVNHSNKEQTVGFKGNWTDIYNMSNGSGNISIAPYNTAILKFDC